MVGERPARVCSIPWRRCSVSGSVGVAVALSLDALGHKGRGRLHADRSSSDRRRGYVGEHAMTEVRRVERSLQTTLHESPLAFGAVALAAGAAMGFALPRTHGEDRIMGETRDAFVGSAGAAAHDAAILVGHVGEKTADAAKQLLSESPADSK